VVDEAALVAALHERRIGGAVLESLDRSAAAEHPLWGSTTSS